MDESSQLELVHKAIRSGVYGHTQWQEAAASRVRNDPDLAGLTPEGIRALLRQFVRDGGSLTVRVETRAEYSTENPCWFRALLPVPGLSRRLFVEVILVDDDPEEPWVEIVSAHRQPC